MTNELESLLRQDARCGDVLTDWTVNSDPEGLAVNAWTAESFTEPLEAVTATEAMLAHVLDLGYTQAGGCEVAASRENPSDDWRGHLVVRLKVC